MLARAAGSPATAADIVGTLPDDRSPDLEVLRARMAIDAGRYGEALTHARRGLAGGVHGARDLAEQAEGQLTVLQPDWRPDVGRWQARLSALRGHTTPGRVLHVAATSLPYRHAGFTLRTQAVARCQLEAGFDPHVVTRAGFPAIDGFRGAPVESDIEGIPHHRASPDFQDVGRLDATLHETARAMVPILETLRPAVMQPASNHLQAQLAFALAEPMGIPVVYEVRGFWEESWAARPTQSESVALQTEHYRLTREVETAAMLRADAVVTLAETMREAIEARGCPAEKIVVVPNAVDVERFQPRPRDAGLAARLDLAASEPVVGYISTFSPYEGIPCLLEAIAILRDGGHRTRVLLVGDGPAWDAIRATATRLGLDDGTLVMPGRVPFAEIDRYYSLIDIFVVPRTADRVSHFVTPLKPYEAMAMERAVVVSDLPALREIVTPGETGLAFRAEDAVDLAETLGTLLDDRALRERLGHQAREWVVASRTWAANGRRYRELFERLGVA